MVHRSCRGESVFFVLLLCDTTKKAEASEREYPCQNCSPYKENLALILVLPCFASTMTFTNVVSSSRQRLVPLVAAAKVMDNNNNHNDASNLMECSSVSSEEDAHDKKYNKGRRRQHRTHGHSSNCHHWSHREGRITSHRTGLGIFLLLAAGLMAWRYSRAQQQNRRRHNSASLYEQAGSLIQDLSKMYKKSRASFSQFQSRRPEDDNLRHRRNFDSHNMGGGAVPHISTSRADASVPSLEELQASFAKQRLLPEQSPEKKEIIPKLLSNWLVSNAGCVLY